MNQIIIDINKLNTLRKAFTLEMKKEENPIREREFYRGGVVALNQVLFDNGFLVEKKDERISEESSI